MQGRVKINLLISIFLFCIPFTARAETVLLTAHLDGPQSGFNDVVGTGFGSFAFDTDTHLLEWNITYENLTSVPFASHIHGPADYGVSAPALLPLTVGDPTVGSATINDTFASALLGGMTYVNFHTTLYPPGEIRGQILPVPEAEIYAMMLMGLGGVLLAARQKKKTSAQITS
jgi:hypothetical protein